MILQYSCSFPSHTKAIKNFVDKFILESTIDGFCYQKDDELVIVVEGEEEGVTQFFDTLSTRLPLSIFMGEGTTIPLEEFKRTWVDSDKTRIDLGICPDCLRSVLTPSSSNYGNIFQSCWNCGPLYSYKVKPTTLEVCGSQELKANNNAAFLDLIELLTQQLILGNSVSVQTFMGMKTFSCFSENHTMVESFLVCNAHHLSNYFYLNAKEQQLLASLERPMVKLALKETVQLKSGSSYVQLAYDGLTALLATALQNKGIDLLCMHDGDNAESTLHVTYSIEPKTPHSHLKVQLIQNRLLLLSGRRSLLPLILPTHAISQAGVAHGIYAMRIDEEADKIDVIENLPLIVAQRVNVLQGEPLPSEHPNSYYFQPYEGAIISVLAEHRVLKNEAFGLYVSLENESGMYLYKPNYPLRKALMIAPMSGCIEQIFSDIAGLDENASRLIDNFQQKFSDYYAMVIKQSVNEHTSQSLGHLFQLVVILLDLGDALTPLQASQTLEKFAMMCREQGGLKLDCFGEKVDDTPCFDWKRYLRSLLSFKLAGVDKSLLAYSAIESLCDYFQKSCEEMMKSFETETIALAGNGLENQVLAGRLIKHLGHKNLLLNKELPVDGENLAYGAMFIGATIED